MTEFWTELLTSPSILIAALFIGSIGEIVKRVVNAKKIEAEVVKYRDHAKPGDKAPALWKRLFYISLPAQPVLAGLALGFVPWLPPADALTKVGFELAGRVATYTLAGVLCKIGYDTLVSTAKRMIRKKGHDTLVSTAKRMIRKKGQEVAPSDSTPPPASDSSPPSTDSTPPASSEAGETPKP